MKDAYLRGDRYKIRFYGAGPNRFWRVTWRDPLNIDPMWAAKVFEHTSDSLAEACDFIRVHGPLRRWPSIESLLALSEHRRIDR